MWKTHEIPALVLLAGGCLAREIERWPVEQVSSWAAEVLRDVFGDEVPEPESVQRTQWDVDPYSRGSYSFVAVGSTPDDIDELAKPIGSRVCFAGEATNRHHWAGAHGAYASGLREAARLLNDPAILPSRSFVENRRWRDTLMRATRLFNLLSNSIGAADAEARLDFLSECDVFSSVPAHELRVLVTMFDPVSFAAGEALCRVGERATCVYALQSGEVEVRLQDDSVVATLGRGNVVGEFGMFQSGRRTATVVARSDVDALSLDYQRFQRFLLAFPESQLALLTLTVDRLIQQSNRLSLRTELP
jgi:CRP-like cAMP-binding protein